MAELVQSLESLNFVDLRINLLQPNLNKFLVKSLFGILLLLPQGKAYKALNKRLSHVNIIYKLDNCISEQKNERKKDENLENLLNIFNRVHFRKKLRSLLNEKNKENNFSEYIDNPNENENEEIIDYIYDIRNNDNSD